MTNSEMNAPRSELEAVAAMATDFVAGRSTACVVSGIDARAVRERLQQYRFERPLPAVEVARDVFDLLGNHAVRSDHPRYFGLFNPPALPAAVMGDLIAAAVNPQLAVWTHAPAAAEIERKVLDLFGTRIGWPAGMTAGTFTGGGSEANLTAMMAALARRYPQWRDGGLARVCANPAVYVSAKSHLAWIKIARMAGLGSEAVRLVPPADGLALTGADLAAFIARDGGRDPMLIVATAGTTAHGAVDHMADLAAVARAHDAHFHVDAAWAGAVVLSDRARKYLDGIEAADSVTIDPHKWLSVPMAAGMYLARNWTPLEAAFDVDTSYMPSASREYRDPYIHSVQWSRRFTGLKVFMALAALGQPGYAALIDKIVALGDRFRTGLGERGWRIENDTHLPLVCFAPGGDGPQDDRVREIASAVVGSGAAWLSTTRLRGKLVLRACITSYETSATDIQALIRVLDDALG